MNITIEIKDIVQNDNLIKSLNISRLGGQKPVIKVIRESDSLFYIQAAYTLLSNVIQKA